MTTVRDLVSALQKADPSGKAEVGIALSRITGWVHGVARVTRDEHGRVVLDQTEETLDLDEATILPGGTWLTG